MSPVKRRRRMPTLINRGLGLLEVIMPRGASDDSESCLPPGQRDAAGFWFPEGYSQPEEIFSAEQRRLQAMQRRIQKRRCAPTPAPAFPAGGDGIMTVHGSSGAAHSPPAAPARPKQALDPEAAAERAVPLPPALPESAHAPRSVVRGRPAAPLPRHAASAGPGRLQESEIQPSHPPSRVVDSRGGSD